MSKNEKVTEQTEEKAMTKYDRKVQKRQEQKKKDQRDKKIGTVVGVVLVVALVCLIASFPIRSYMMVHQNFIEINGEEISRVEFDYNYNVVKNNYMDQYGSYMAYFGLDVNSDLSTQQYSDNLSWQDYFEQQTVDSMLRSKALKAQAEAAGFTYDVDAEYANFKQGVADKAKEQGVSEKELLQQMYGSLATFGRIEKFAKESIYVNAFYTQVSDEKAPTDDAIQTYYEEHTQDYDSVDYYQTVIKAELPTEPTELADPVEETDSTDTTSSEDTAYQPSDAEIEKAMADAKALTADAEDKVTTDGELKEGGKYSGTSSLIRDWLYDASRKEGDSTIIEDNNGHQYYVISFVKRYLDQTPSADLHIIMATDGNGQTILDDWKNGDATEESFAALADLHNEGTSLSAEGGLYEKVTPSGTYASIAEWMSEEGRTAGDTTVIDTEDGNQYVVYYVKANDPEWKLTVRSQVLSDTMEQYLQDISADFAVEDPKGNLNYLKVQAAESEAAATAETETAESDTTEAAETAQDGQETEVLTSEAE